MRAPESDTEQEPELVVLATSDGLPAGTHPKATVHSAHTPLHFAFSCYLLDHSGRVLLTRRALNKPTWPGVWTNSMCGHPGPGESAEQAMLRRGGQELGLGPGVLIDAQLVLPDFRYRATDSSGIVEWEICPVFVATLGSDAQLNPAASEVDSWQWVEPAELAAATAAAPFVFSPWMRQQLSHTELRRHLGL